MSKDEQKLVCPHCGNKTILETKFKYTAPEEFFDLDGEPVGVLDYYYYFVVCRTCDSPALFCMGELDDDSQGLSAAICLYPKDKKFSSSVSKAIREVYDEAKKVKKVSSSAFAVLIRKALEILCAEQKAVGKNLKEKLDFLATENIIPKNLAKMTHAIRYIGNVSAHFSNFKIGEDEAAILDDFFNAIIEYVYIAPQKIKKLEEKLQKKKS